MQVEGHPFERLADPRVRGGERLEPLLDGRFGLVVGDDDDADGGKQVEGGHLPTVPSVQNRSRWLRESAVGGS